MMKGCAKQWDAGIPNTLHPLCSSVEQLVLHDDGVPRERSLSQNFVVAHCTTWVMGRLQSCALQPFPVSAH